VGWARSDRVDASPLYAKSLVNYRKFPRPWPSARRRAALAAGHKLVATARNPEQLADLAKRYGKQVRAVALDVTDARAAGNAIEAAVNEFGRLDVLVNNAGYGDVSSIEDTSEGDFRAQIEIGSVPTWPRSPIPNR
jgi:NAD(P)-dependent dehydrogenase (short-subunit alcohol dehydrogenase family)